MKTSDFQERMVNILETNNYIYSKYRSHYFTLVTDGRLESPADIGCTGMVFSFSALVMSTSYTFWTAFTSSWQLLFCLMKQYLLHEPFECSQMKLDALDNWIIGYKHRESIQ